MRQLSSEIRRLAVEGRRKKINSVEKGNSGLCIIRVGGQKERGDARTKSKPASIKVFGKSLPKNREGGQSQKKKKKKCKGHANLAPQVWSHWAGRSLRPRRFG